MPLTSCPDGLVLVNSQRFPDVDPEFADLNRSSRPQRERHALQLRSNKFTLGCSSDIQRSGAGVNKPVATSSTGHCSSFWTYSTRKGIQF
ncbi:hypothetical protein OUZ56_001204 [Daphnia magna]|uniref:Uncharacterized protein n=1 Tax=Daphnia magna TaxID=35525 RepID=A0ABR0A1X4_9CRUS|nr:hypothetical protein OUZ56_001204 [Daphnia magna]